MYKFGKNSLKQLKTLHPDLQTVLNSVIMYYDFSIIEGLRSDERQQELFKDGKSQLDGVNKKSKHQGRTTVEGDFVSHAVDLMPYYKGFNPFASENGPKSFYYLAGLIQMTAQMLYTEGKISHIIRWGGNWDSDMDFFGDSNFFDLPHFELIKP